MAYIKWIGAFLGALNGGVLGALAGYAIGSIIDKVTSNNNNDNDEDYRRFHDAQQRFRQQQEAAQEGARNSFLFSMLVLSAHIIQADGKIMHSEMETVRHFIRNNFGEAAVEQANSILLRLFDYHKQQGDAAWNRQIREACMEMRRVMPAEHRMQLVAFLAEIAKADGRIDNTEIQAIREITLLLGLNAAIVDQLLSLGGTTLDDAYKVLGISPDASDDDVRRAYRQLVKENHPDRFATLGDDVKEAAKKKMQEINEAKERIYKERGM